MMDLMRRTGLALWLCMLAGAALAAGEVRIEGNRFVRDGAPWVAEGVTLVGFVAPKERITKPAYAAAREEFGPDMLEDIGDFGADLVRFQVSQAALDPLSEIFDPAYRDEVLQVIAQTREAGFSVLVSMQWQGVSGMKNQEVMPSNTTRRAWLSLVEALGQDGGILLELFNEPGLRDTRPVDWERWQEDMQSLIDLVRDAGARNVLLVGGLKFSHSFKGAPELYDPLDDLGFAVHPYLTQNNQKRGQWDRKFGNFAQDHAMMATEFMSHSNGPCREALPEQTLRLLDYLREKRIGLVAWAFDLPVMRRDGRLSTFDDFACGRKQTGGAGEVLHDYFLSQ